MFIVDHYYRIKTMDHRIWKQIFFSTHASKIQWILHRAYIERIQPQQLHTYQLLSFLINHTYKIQSLTISRENESKTANQPFRQTSETISRLFMTEKRIFRRSPGLIARVSEQFRARHGYVGRSGSPLFLGCEKWRRGVRARGGGTKLGDLSSRNSGSPSPTRA